MEVTIASDSSVARGICTRSGKVRHLSIKELWIQEACRKQEFQLVSVDMLSKLGRHWNEITHVRAPDVVAETDATSPERGSDKGAGVLRVVE